MQGNGSEAPAQALELKGREPLDARLKYPANLVESYGLGAVMDIKLRFAMQILSSPAAAEAIRQHHSPGRSLESDQSSAGKVAAEFALAASTRLVELAEEQGLISKLQAIDGPELLDAIAVTAARLQGALSVEGQVGASVYGQWASAKAQVDGPRIMQAAPAVAAAIKLGGR